MKEITKLARIIFEKQTSLQKISDSSGISKMTISKLCRGKIIDPKIGTLKKIAKALNCKVSDIWEVK